MMHVTARWGTSVPLTSVILVFFWVLLKHVNVGSMTNLHAIFFSNTIHQKGKLQFHPVRFLSESCAEKKGGQERIQRSLTRA